MFSKHNCFKFVVIVSCSTENETKYIIIIIVLSNMETTRIKMGYVVFVTAFLYSNTIFYFDLLLLAILWSNTKS